MAYYGNEPSKVAVTVGQGVIDASHIEDASISTLDISNDAITPNKIDDDGTGFQMGSLGLGGAVSGEEKLTVTGTASFSGAITGDLTGDVTGDVSGSSATVTGATQSAITSTANLATVGTITTGVWNAGAVTSTGALTLQGANNTDSSFHLKNTANADNYWQIYPNYNSDDLYIKGNGSTVLTLGTDQSATFAGELRVNGGQASIYGAEDGDAVLELNSDEADDNADRWQVYVDSSDSNKFKFRKYSTGSWVDTFSIDTSQNAKIGRAHV